MANYYEIKKNCGCYKTNRNVIIQIHLCKKHHIEYGIDEGNPSHKQVQRREIYAFKELFGS